MSGAEGAWIMNCRTIVAAASVAASTLVFSLTLVFPANAQEGSPNVDNRAAVKPPAPGKVIASPPAPGRPGNKVVVPRQPQISGRQKRPAVTPRPAAKRPPAPIALPGVRRGVLLRQVWVWSAPSRQARRISQLKKGVRVPVMGAQSGFYQVTNRRGQRGWILQNAVRLL